MIVYNLIFIILAMFSFLELFTGFPIIVKKLVVVLISLGLVFMSSIYNGEIGDYNAYSNHFDNISGNQFEYLYELLKCNIKNVVNDYQFFRMVLGILVIGLWYKICTFNNQNELKKSDENNLQYSLTILLVLWALNFGNIFIIRSTIAVSVCIFSIRYIQNRNLWKFIVCTIIAMGFHAMSIVWVPAYWIYHKNYLQKYYFMVLIIPFALSDSLVDTVLYIASFFGGRIYQRIDIYLSIGSEESFSIIYDNTVIAAKAILNMIFLLVVFSFIIHYKKNQNNAEVCSSYTCLYLVGSIIYLIGLKTSMALTRAAVPYNMAQYFLLPRLFDITLIKNNIRIKFLVFFLLLIYLYLRMYVTINSNVYVPFYTIWGDI